MQYAEVLEFKGIISKISLHKLGFGMNREAVHLTKMFKSAHKNERCLDMNVFMNSTGCVERQRGLSVGCVSTVVA